MTDNFNVSWPVNWPKFARKQIFIPKRLDSMFARALVPGWRPFVNKVYSSVIFRVMFLNFLGLVLRRWEIMFVKVFSTVFLLFCFASCKTLQNENYLHELSSKFQNAERSETYALFSLISRNETTLKGLAFH